MIEVQEMMSAVLNVGFYLLMALWEGKGEKGALPGLYVRGPG